MHRNRHIRAVLRWLDRHATQLPHMSCGHMGTVQRGRPYCAHCDRWFERVRSQQDLPL